MRYRRYLKERLRELQDLPIERDARLETGALDYAQSVDRIRGIPAESIDAVRDSVRRAYWSVNRRISWVRFLERRLNSFDLTYFPIVIFYMISIWISWPWMVDAKDFRGFPSDGYFMIGLYAVAMLKVHGVVLETLRMGLPPWTQQLWRVLVIGGTLTLTIWRDWCGLLIRWAAVVESEASHAAVRRDLSIHGDTILLYTLKVFAAIVGLGFLVELLNYLIFRAGPKEPKGVISCASLLLALYDLALQSQKVLDVECGSRVHGFRSYLVSSERRSIIDQLDIVARLAEGGFKRALRLGDYASDAASANLADGIAAAARKWKSVAAVGGNSLEGMQEAFASALVDAAEGKWEYLAVEASSKELLGRRLFLMARHAIAFAIMTGAVLFTTFRPLGWPDYAANPAVNYVLLVFAAIVSAAIDPTIVERVGNAARLGSSFRK